MGVAKCARIFEAEAEGAIETDMGDPDQRHRQERGLSGEETGDGEQQRQRIGVRDIVGGGPGARPNQLAEHREVRSEKQNREQRPGKSRVRIERGRGRKGSRAFEPQDRAHRAGRETGRRCRSCSVETKCRCH